MPGGDRTGPNGMGPMTGRGAGFCGGFNSPGYMNPVPGRGRGFGSMGFGRGFGRGWRRGPWFSGYAPQGYPYPSASPASREDELNSLQEEAKGIEGYLSSLKSRIDELQKSSES